MSFLTSQSPHRTPAVMILKHSKFFSTKPFASHILIVIYSNARKQGNIAPNFSSNSTMVHSFFFITEHTASGFNTSFQQIINFHDFVM
jgi:hypothetical protein